MPNDFDDILGPDDPEKEHKKWMEANEKAFHQTDKPASKSYRKLTGVYEKSMDKWEVEDGIRKQLQKEMNERFERAKERLEEEKKELEDFTPDKSE